MKTPNAVIQLAGKQFQVAEGDQLVVDRLPGDEKTLTISDVLLINTGKSVKIGDPTVKGASVKLSRDEDNKGPKIRVAKFKSKSRYRRVQGHRQFQTVLTVKSINAK